MRGALPGYKQVEKIHHLSGQGYSRYPAEIHQCDRRRRGRSQSSRGTPLKTPTREITSEARNQYTLGYSPQAIKGSSAYRAIEVQVDKKGLNIFTKAAITRFRRHVSG